MIDYDNIQDDQDDWTEDFDQIEDLTDAGDLPDESDAAWAWTDEERAEAAELAATLEDTEPPADQAGEPGLAPNDDFKTLEDLKEETAAWYENLEERVGTPYDDLDTIARIGQAERRAEALREASTAGNLSDAIDATLKARSAMDDNSDVEIAERLKELHGVQVPYTDAYGVEPSAEDEPKSVTDEDILLDELSERRAQIEQEAKDDAEELKKRP